MTRGPRLESAALVRFFFGWPAYLEACRRRYGDVFHLRLPVFGRVVVVGHPEAIRAVFLDPGATSASNGRARATLTDVIGDGSVLFLEGAGHLHRRRLLLPRFNGEDLASYERVMADAIDERIEQWRPGERITLRPVMHDVTVEVIARIVYGIEDPVQARYAATLFSRLAKAFAVTLLLPPKAKTERIPGPWRRLVRIREEFNALFQRQIDERRRDPGERTDVCALLTTATDEHGRPLSDEEIRSELFAMTLAGSHTTALTLSWAFDRVLHTPSTLAALEARPDDDALLTAIVQETLRLHPPVDAGPRVLSRDMDLRGVPVAAGEIIYPSSQLVHTRPDLYEAPHAFRPERFLGRRPGTYEWIPFGGGSRRCLGDSYAQMELRVVLGRVFSRWCLRAADPQLSRARRTALNWVPVNGVPVIVDGPR